MSFVKLTERLRTFTGRNNEINFFIQNILEAEEPSYNIISISGIGGIGKSALIARFIDQADITDYPCITALVDERNKTPLSILEEFANQLRDVGESLKEFKAFDEALKRHKEDIRKIQLEQANKRDVLLTKAAELAGSMVKDAPVIGGVAEKGLGPAIAYLLEEHRYRQLLKDVERMADPIRTLTEGFIDALNSLALDRRVILFFDTFDELAFEITPWLLDHFLKADISYNIVMVIAGRDPIKLSSPENPKIWLPHRDNNTIFSIYLQSFTEQETYEYLAARGIREQQSISTLWQLSRGLPLYLSLLTFNLEVQADPTEDVVANFLCWIPEQESAKRRLALDSALLSRPFNQDDIEVFRYVPESERSTFYTWLVRQSFIQSRSKDGRRFYHELVQEMFCRYLYQRSPKGYYTTRKTLADYYRRQRNKIQTERGKGAFNSPEWLDLTLALIQQLFFLPEDIHHIDAIEEILAAYHHTRQGEQIISILRRLSQSHYDYQMSLDGHQVITLILRYLTVNIQYQGGALLETATDILERALLKTSFSKDLLADIYCRRASAYFVLTQYEQAINDLNQALELNPTNAKAFNQRGRVNHTLKKPEQAIDDFNSAINLYPAYAEAYAYRGETYRLLRKYQQALDDFDTAVKLNPKLDWVYASRGLVNRTLMDVKQTKVNPNPKSRERVE